MHALTFDLETCALDNAVVYLDPVKPAANLKDPEKIAADITKREQERVADLALDWNVARICAIGWQQDDEPIQVRAIRDETEEADALRAFWLARQPESHVPPRLLVGFRCRTFDLPFLIQRSRYLGVWAPAVSLDRYRDRDVVDLYDLLTFRDQPTTWAMRRTLKAFCRRFGIDVPPDIDGKDIAACVASGDYDTVVAHCRQDVALTIALAQAVGVLVPSPMGVS